jgi:hypothetical protein
MLAALFAGGLVSIAALQAAYYFAVHSPLWASGSLAAADLARSNSLAGWCSAFIMFAAGVTALFIYSLRRYRLDDYRGRYRVWLGAAALWMIMSIDGLANIRSAVRALGIAFSGYTGPGDGVVWWLAPWSMLILWFGIRMVLDVRACRTATASLVLGYAAVIAGFVLPQVAIALAAEQAVMLIAACDLLGRWLLFCGQVAYARHVLFEAHGRLPVRQARPKREKKKPEPAHDEAVASVKPTATSTKRRDDLTMRIDPPHNTHDQPATAGIDLQRPSGSSAVTAKPPAAGVTASARATTAPTSTKPTTTATKSSTRFIGGHDDEDDEPAASHKLSRAERKRLRKQQRAERDEDD